MRIWLAALIVLASGAGHAVADPLRSGAEAVRDRALHDPTAYDYVESLSVEVGPRLAGSEAAARARDWAVAKLTSLGFSQVHVEPFPITAWLRGPEEAEIVAPRPQKRAIIGLGGSVPPPPRPMIASFCGRGATISASSGPRSQAVIGNGSTCTWENPSEVSLATAQSRALAAASLPASRGPTSTERDST